VKEGSGDHDGSRTDCACKAPLLKAAVDAGNVTILGRVPDDELGALMQRYRVFASPLFDSTGVATKNLAAMAAGAPLVTTSSGLQGLKLALQQAVLPVADDAYTFSRLLLLLQRNSDAFLAAQTRGLDHARDYLSAEASRAALYDVLAKTVDPRMLRLPSEPMEPDLPFSHRLLSTAAQRRERLLQRVDAPPERAKFADVLVSPGSRTTALALDAPDSAGKEMAALVAHATEGVRSLLAGTASQAGAELGACRQLIEKDGAAERGEVVLAVGGPSQQQVNDEATPAQLQDGAAQALLARAAAHATAAGGAEHALLLRGCALQQAATLPFSEDKARGALSRAGIRWAGDEGLRQENVLRCPLAAGGSPHRQDARSVSNVSQQLLKLQATLLSAGGGKPSNSSTASALNWPRLSPMVFESGDWPKLAGPAAAKGQELRMLDPVTHLQEHDGVMTKLVNLKRRLEVRKVWKAGSTMIGPLLDCVQPGEWQDVRQSTATPRGYNVHALVKEPIKRFSAALAEVVRRAFFGICPSGACTAETDGWMPEKLQHKLRRETSWYDKAAALLLADANASKGDGANATIGDDVALHSFLAAAVDDTSRSRLYYAAEHFLTQSVQLMQGSSADPWLVEWLDEKGSAEPTPTLHRVEDFSTADGAAASSLMRAVGANADKLRSCWAGAQEATPGPEQAAAAAAVSSHDPSFAAKLEAVTDDALAATLARSPALIVQLCAVYAQDILCLPYDVPEECRGLLS